jgi:predicted nucleic acid-binding protein
MNVLVDTSIWSLALRKNKNNKSSEQIEIINEFKELIKELRVKIIGPIRQEILSGIKDKNLFDKLKDKLKYFSDDNITTEDYEYGAELFNLCRSKGIQGSYTDFIICAIAVRKKYVIFTLDKDFENYCKIIGLKLYKLK